MKKQIYVAKNNYGYLNFRELLDKIKQVKIFKLCIKDVTPVKDTEKTFLNSSNGGCQMKSHCFYAKKMQFIQLYNMRGSKVGKKYDF